MSEFDENKVQGTKTGCFIYKTKNEGTNTKYKCTKMADKDNYWYRDSKNQTRAHGNKNTCETSRKNAIMNYCDLTDKEVYTKFISDIG